MGIFNKNKQRKQDGVDMTQPETMAQQVDDNSIEPELVQTSRSKKDGNKLKKLFMLGGSAVGLLFIASSLIALTGGNDEETQETLEQPSILTDIEGKGSGSFDLEGDKDAIAAEEEKRRLAELARQKQQAEEDAQNGVITNEDGTKTQVVAQQTEEPKIDPILERRLGGSVLVNDGADIQTNQNNATAQASYGGGVPRGFGEESNANERQLNFTGTTFSPRIASKRDDKTLLLTRGTTIPCVLITKIVTDHAGLTKCQATKNVWSADGKTILIERGSVFLGEQTAAMLQGQARVAVRWTQMETPKGILVDIDSPSVGKLGAAGNAAWVNTHFWKRFGGSIMISLIGDISNGVSKRIGKSHSDFTLEESADNLDEMATEALKNSINIPPTGTINQGALLNIMVARDIDFRSVYERIDISDLQGALPTAAATIQKPTLPTNMSVITE